MTLDKLEAQVIAMTRPSAPLTPDQSLSECVPEGSRGLSYRGSLSITRNGLTCQQWAPQLMRISGVDESALAELRGHNYCRNVDNDPAGPWCYTTNPHAPKDYCSMPVCGASGSTSNSHDLIRTSSLDKSLLRETKLVVGACIAFLAVVIAFLMVFCVCRVRGAGATTSSAQHLVMSKQTSASLSNNGTSGAGAQIHPSRLRMSNVSLAKKHGQPGKIHRGGGSSKSSVASSATNHNNASVEVNPFIRGPNSNNYDNQQTIFNYQQQMMQHQVPQFQTQMQHQHIQQQHFQQQQQQLQQQQAPQLTNNECDFSVKQISANNLRLLQEVGKGN